MRVGGCERGTRRHPGVAAARATCLRSRRRCADPLARDPAWASASCAFGDRPCENTTSTVLCPSSASTVGGAALGGLYLYTSILDLSLLGQLRDAAAKSGYQLEKLRSLVQS